MSDRILDVESLGRRKVAPANKVEEFISFHAPVAGEEPISPEWTQAFLLAVQEAYASGHASGRLEGLRVASTVAPSHLPSGLIPVAAPGVHGSGCKRCDIRLPRRPVQVRSFVHDDDNGLEYFCTNRTQRGDPT